MLMIAFATQQRAYARKQSGPGASRLLLRRKEPPDEHG